MSPEKKTVKQFIEEYLSNKGGETTQDNYRRAIARWLGYLGVKEDSTLLSSKRLFTVGVSQAEKFLDLMREEGRKNSTLAGWRSGLVGLHDQLRVEIDGHINPWDGVVLTREQRAPSEQSKPIPVDVVIKLRKATSPSMPTPTSIRDHAIIGLLFGAGLSKGEILGLECEDVIERDNEVFLRLPNREIAITKWAADGVLRQVQMQRRTGKVIPLSSAGLHLRFKHCLTQVGAPEYSLKDARLTTVKQFLEHGVSTEQIAEFTGHKGERTIERLKQQIIKPSDALKYDQK